MKGWKSWPYWVKGGIIGFLCYVLNFLIALASLSLGISQLQFGASAWEVKLFSFIEKLTRLELIYTDGWWGLKTTELGTDVAMTIQILGPIFVGVLLGYLYGKFSSKGGSASGGKNRNLNTGTPHQSTTTPPRE